ncbi:tetratricopeptide repeat protein [Empedobacter falsenii]|uniref:Tetratricopeptide repeat protein n=1 Tax=Empedobacter falsenii TaxID=343874 RepID=A0AAW7DFY5_9FLAO|nr:tetratricopeptide repeat protein [Empedobacter falsenii]MDM1550356.1 hypothetical protein [Empedobacter falsenii]
MKYLKSLFVLISITASTFSLACLNGESRILSTDSYLYEDREGNIPYGHTFYTENLDNDLKKIDSLFAVKPDADLLSDKGLILILQGKYQQAIDLYLEVEKKYPNRYSTASNIGTAYELIGDNENALKWISKALVLNPDSHNKSEWIHQNILKIKLKQLQLSSESLINTDFGNEDFPVSTLSKEDLNSLKNQLYFQLNERRSFIQPKDEIMAQLLFDYGNILLLLGEKEAKEVYEIAKQYGFSNELIDRRIEESKSIKSYSSSNSNEENSLKKFFQKNWDTILITLLSIIIFFFVFKAKERKRRN